MIVTKHQNRLPRRLLSLRYACAHLTEAHLLSPVVVCFSKNSRRPWPFSPHDDLYPPKENFVWRLHCHRERERRKKNQLQQQCLKHRCPMRRTRQTPRNVGDPSSQVKKKKPFWGGKKMAGGSHRVSMYLATTRSPPPKPSNARDNTSPPFAARKTDGCNEKWSSDAAPVRWRS